MLNRLPPLSSVIEVEYMVDQQLKFYVVFIQCIGFLKRKQKDIRSSVSRFWLVTAHVLLS